MDNVRLKQMSKLEFEISLAQFRDRITKDAMKACGITEEKAKKIVESDLSRIGQDGFETKNNSWYSILNDNGKNIGSLWLFFRGEGDQQTPYLTDLILAPDFRGKGLGKQVLSLLESELKSQGIKNNIAVHIIGDFNISAIKLFKSSGYFVTGIKMERLISS